MYLVKEHIKDINLDNMDELQRVVIDNCIYTKKEIMEINEVINFIIESVPKLNNQNNRDKEVFSYVYVMIANLISYDEDASKYLDLGGYHREMSEPYVNQITGLYGLVSRKAICSGYSKILKEVLYYFGIECKIINCNQGTKETEHAWNQVFLDGVWYNCDLTNDVDFILNNLECPYFLKSDKDFNRLVLYPNLKTSKEECNGSVTLEEQKRMTTYYNDYVKRILSLNEEKVKTRNFMDRLKLFLEKNISGRRK